MQEKAFPFLSVALVALLAFAVSGCQPQIGDKCVLNTDCSATGTLQCDTSMPGGYCTIFNCGPNTCPNENACYLFHGAVQGCPYNDRDPSRTGHSFCMKDCEKDSDCRTGYICADLRGPPWNAVLLDDDQIQSVCTIGYDSSFTESGQLPDANAPPIPICEADPDIDAAFPEPPDAGVEAIDAGTDAAPQLVDAGADAALDAGIDATLTDAGVDASDASAPDATID